MAGKIDWKKAVSESNGTRLFLPEKFTKQVEEVENRRVMYNGEVQRMAKKEILMNFETQKVFIELREHLEKNGYPDIWVKDIGFDTEALKEGIFVINIRENSR